MPLTTGTLSGPLSRRTLTPDSARMRTASRRLLRQGFAGAAQQMAMASEQQRLGEAMGREQGIRSADEEMRIQREELKGRGLLAWQREQAMKGTGGMQPTPPTGTTAPPSTGTPPTGTPPTGTTGTTGTPPTGTTTPPRPSPLATASVPPMIARMSDGEADFQEIEKYATENNVTRSAAAEAIAKKRYVERGGSPQASARNPEADYAEVEKYAKAKNIPFMDAVKILTKKTQPAGVPPLRSDWKKVAESYTKEKGAKDIEAAKAKGRQAFDATQEQQGRASLLSNPMGPPVSAKGPAFTKDQMRLLHSGGNAAPAPQSPLRTAPAPRPVVTPAPAPSVTTAEASKQSLLARENQSIAARLAANAAARKKEQEDLARHDFGMLEGTPAAALLRGIGGGGFRQYRQR